MTTKVIAHHNLKAFSRIRLSFQKNFRDLVPRHRSDLTMIDSSSVECGFYFSLVSQGSAGETDTYKSIDELSGGQKALLGISFVFACALDRQQPLYLLDEVL